MIFSLQWFLNTDGHVEIFDLESNFHVHMDNVMFICLFIVE